MQDELRAKYITLLKKCGIDYITAEILINITDSFGYYPGSNDGKHIGLNCKRKANKKTQRAANCIDLSKGNFGVACISKETNEETNEVELDIYDKDDTNLPISLVVFGVGDMNSLDRRFRAIIFDNRDNKVQITGNLDLEGNITEATIEPLYEDEKLLKDIVVSNTSLFYLAQEPNLHKVLTGTAKK